MKKIIYSLFSGLLLSGFMAGAAARELPDFTDLVEKQGPAVVNISTATKVQVRSPRGIPNMPNIPEDDPFYDFFRRFIPQQPGGPQEIVSLELPVVGIVVHWRRAEVRRAGDVAHGGGAGA